MRPYARWLFGIAAVSNLTVAWALLFVSTAATFIGLAPVKGSHAVLLNFAASMIGLFGYGYLRIAMDPLRFRPLIHVSAIGKLLAVASAVGPWVDGEIPARLPSILAPDVIFALLFFDYLRRSIQADAAAGQ